MTANSSLEGTAFQAERNVKCDKPGECGDWKFGLTEVALEPSEKNPDVGATWLASCATVSIAFNEAVKKCLQGDARALFFGAWREKLFALLPAYELLLAMAMCGETAIGIVAAHPHFSKRQPSKRNPALMAVRLITRPNWEDDFKIASDYAAMLAHAKDESIAVTDFLRWAEGKTLRACRKAVSAKRRSKIAPLPATFSDPAHQLSEAVTGQAAKVVHDEDGARLALDRLHKPILPTAAQQRTESTKVRVEVINGQVREPSTDPTTSPNTKDEFDLGPRVSWEDSECIIACNGALARGRFRVPVNNEIPLPALLRRLADWLEWHEADRNERDHA
jgi:hypothetical protein